MKTNILQAINSLIDNDLHSIERYKTLSYKIRINNMGEALENLIKDALCNNFNLEADKRIAIQSEYFSYLGNQNNPPDLIIKNGDAFEVKKIETNEGSIALNSSFPKDKLYRNSNMITIACKNCEADWIEKDICYIIGCVDKSEQIKSLWFVYGDCYCAKPEIYTRVKNKITNAVSELGIELSETNEIAKFKNVDHLGITNLRVRGIWGIKHPSKVFEYLTTKSSKPHIKALMLKEKFYSFDDDSRNEILKKCNVRDVKIQNPNNPAKLMDAILIEYEFNI
ncbi:MAG: NgoPII family restriction endonuclease [Rickettsiales bacterium]|nr:NgoPII family restriction endonuclease [Rickettsiales bacterium]